MRWSETCKHTYEPKAIHHWKWVNFRVTEFLIEFYWKRLWLANYYRSLWTDIAVFQHLFAMSVLTRGFMTAIVPVRSISTKKEIQAKKMVGTYIVIISFIATSYCARFIAVERPTASSSDTREEVTSRKCDRFL